MSTPDLKLRNIAIIAHVDHGKTTLVDAMLRQTGVFRSHEAVTDRVMDSNDLERERGITILAKNASIRYGEYKINIIDTPGHADFGGEVERTLKMADGALLLVDAAEGPLPQTRFVLSKALELGMPIIVVINKIDRQDARPDAVLNETFDLFCDLEASDEQTAFPTLYAVGKEGIASTDLAVPGTSLTPLLDCIIATVPAPKGDPDAPLQMLVHNTVHDEYVGKLAICRIHHGRATTGQQIALLHEEQSSPQKLVVLFGFESLKRVKIESAVAGDIVAVAGIDSVQIGDTIAHPSVTKSLPRIVVEQPTIKVQFLVNDSPFAGKVGKWVTSRHLRDRLYKEANRNIAMKVEDTASPDTFTVFGRGELMLAILAETMRREGYEFAVGTPEVVTREIDGVRCEPVERVVIDVPEDFVGVVTTRLGERRGKMEKMAVLGHGRVRLEFKVPSESLIGFRSQFLTETRGTGLLNTLFDSWIPGAEVVSRRRNGSMVSDRKGITTPYALYHLQPRGVMCVEPGVEVYEGMVVGEHNRPNDLDVNVVREKKQTNIRAAGKDENIILSPARAHTIETAMEYIDRDEIVEITPAAVRIRKRQMDSRIRPKRAAAAD
ncbi:MAG TPA: translational GTPase TypA [Polyangiaceae bacterium]|jgi:GTP-binding protein|nr:translational GTPase TypA [Polyangiaceae bacterium]